MFKDTKFSSGGNQRAHPCRQLPPCGWLKTCVHIPVSRVSVKVLQQHHAATTATILFLLNPASVFYTAAYTEALFAALSLAGCAYLDSSSWLSTLLFAASSATRSNGAPPLTTWSDVSWSAGSDVLHPSSTGWPCPPILVC
jgi:hypothetical protein